MAIIQTVISLVILGFLYGRMIQRETPARVTKAQAIVPIVLGVISLFLSFGFVLAIMASLKAIGFSTASFPPLLRSVCSAFLTAGLPEELAKLLIMLVCIRAFRSSIRNVYEYILIGAAVGFGFSLFEEFLYGGDSIVIMVGRIALLAGHMVFGMIMARHLGMARYNIISHSGSVGGEYVLAILIPVLIHTLFDALTADNTLLSSSDDFTITIGFLLSLVALVALFVMQIVVLVRFRKHAEKYCGMKLI